MSENESKVIKSDILELVKNVNLFMGDFMLSIKHFCEGVGIKNSYARTLTLFLPAKG